jgi:hypothetical protein
MSGGRSLLALMLTLVAASAFGTTLCRGKRGVVSVRDVCRKRETAIPLDALGVAGIPGAPGPQGAAGPAPVHLVDATGVDVGPVLRVSATASNNQVTSPVLFTHPSLPGPVLLAVTGDGRIGGVVYYASTDCTGPAYSDLQGWLPILQGVQSTVYVPGAPLPGMLHAGSFEYSDPQNDITGCPVRTAQGSCCYPFDTMRSVLTTTATSLAALGLTPPFTAVVK